MVDKYYTNHIDDDEEMNIIFLLSSTHNSRSPQLHNLKKNPKLVTIIDLLDSSGGSSCLNHRPKWRL